MLASSCAKLEGLAGPEDAGDAATNNDAPDVEVDSGPAPRCPPDQKQCGDGCVPKDLPEFGCAADSCERCSLPNAAAVKCEGGKCAVAKCNPGTASCDGKEENGCEADLTDATTCGSCTSACPLDQFCDTASKCVPDCSLAEFKCGRKCVDYKTSKTNCGECFKVCAGAPNAVPACVDGVCKVDCNVGYGDCNPAAIGCEPLSPYYVDADGDGFGTGTKVGDACTAPAGHSNVLGDCDDSNPNVKPGQTAYFTAGYTNAAGKTSYDYDCNGVEAATPGKALGACGATCRAGDYLPSARPNPPPGANLICGSSTLISSCSTSSASGSGSGSGSSCYSSSASTVGCR
jgi:hypothetical protein